MRLRTFMAGALMVSAPALIAWVLAMPSAVAQVAVSPASVEASLAAGEQGEIDLTVTNEGTASVNLFAVPLSEEGMPEEPPGTLLFSTEPGTVYDPYDIAMAESGRLFVADYSTSDHETKEYTADLALVGAFPHPIIGRTSSTVGVAWMPPEHAPSNHEEGTLWWMDIDIDCDGPHCTVVSTLLIEGDLDGNATGRTVDLYDALGPGNTDSPLYYDRGVPLHLSYDTKDECFYYVDWVNEDIWAINVDGEVVEGYPVALVDYDPNDENELLQAGLDAPRGADGGRYLDLGVVLPGEEYNEARVAVTDRQGRATGAETPLTRLEPPDGQGEVVRVMGVLRSRLDPSVMYLSIIAQYLDGSGHETTRWVVAIRAHPLPPRWLRVSPVAPLSLEIAPGETDTLTVRLDTEGMEPGVYTGQVALRDGGPNGEEVVTVPVTLTVTPGVDTEGGPEPEEETRLAVYPNPSQDAATVILSLETASEVRVVVYDVLGREVAVLHDGRLGAGEHALAFEVAGLPAGLYLLRSEGGSTTMTQRITVVR